MMLLGTVAVSALLTAMLLIAARYGWRAGSRLRRRSWAPFRYGPDADAAQRRHPAGRGRHAALMSSDLAGPLSSRWPPPTGPDDDPEFIDALERLIRGGGDDT